MLHGCAVSASDLLRLIIRINLKTMQLIEKQLRFFTNACQ